MSLQERILQITMITMYTGDQLYSKDLKKTFVHVYRKETILIKHKCSTQQQIHLTI